MERELAQLQARLIPPDISIWPDFTGALLLTEGTLYVLEPEYGGGFTEHFVIPISHIESIELHVPEQRRRAIATRIVHAVFGVLSGLMMVGDHMRPPDPILIIAYVHPETGERWELCFREVVGSVSHFVRLFRQRQAELWARGAGDRV